MFALASKVFNRSKAILECINYDLEFVGYNYIKERYRTMSCVKTLNNEYTIYFDRHDSSINYGEYQYVCIMKFNDIVGCTRLDLKFTEVEAFTMIDALSEFLNFGMSDIAILSIGDVNMNTYTVYVNKIPGKELYKFTIRQYNAIYQTLNDIVSFYMDDDLIDTMLYNCYFSYLIDIDNEDYPYIDRIADIISTNPNNTIVDEQFSSIVDRAINYIPDE